MPAIKYRVIERDVFDDQSMRIHQRRYDAGIVTPGEQSNAQGPVAYLEPAVRLQNAGGGRTGSPRSAARPAEPIRHRDPADRTEEAQRSVGYPAASAGRRRNPRRYGNQGVIGMPGDEAAQASEVSLFDNEDVDVGEEAPDDDDFTDEELAAILASQAESDTADPDAEVS
ncbi:hypothetical protein Q2K19_31625 [Micromonospora soli]|uniref:hypothetical protein n=1 Tax=Micromonospora sp. NBRC 110009 TaxID=3061627 RepID=UPI0026723FD8|nr:hypothetical protein [Micromonospora sp. NBRC 110009]WKT98644.1 hypothetical protein Q2K19_31625 [Micromonospora sp. NBRC 110009]